MAKGKATPASFVKGDPRAVAAGRKSSRALPPEVKEARQMNAVRFEAIIYKYMDTPVERLQEIAKDKSTPAIDLVVIKLLVLAIQHGDIARLNLLLERTIGKVTDKIQVDNNTTIRNLHDAIIQKLENGGQ
jgi:hypothetical protein